MAKKALLIWCAGSAVVCGSAALATTSLWREPVPAVQTAAVSPPVVAALEIEAPDLPPQLMGFEAVEPGAGAFPPVGTISFFEPAAERAGRLFRPSLGPDSVGPLAALEQNAAVAPASAEAPTAGESPAIQPPPRPDFAEIVAEDVSSRDPRLAVRPPPRPGFTLASIEPVAKPITEVAPAQPAPGFSEQRSSPWSLGSAFRAPEAAARPERVMHAGVASWYGPRFHGRKTASGERFNQNDMTAAHRTLPFGTRVKVVDETTGRSVVVRINDRGPFAHGRVIDLSKAASEALGMGGRGVARVTLVAAN
ncbi:rare lipoprotein A [Enterovirga rhinocerotis]|uniref:Endolytic peptidoglycan transglycosylase RlpA n=2 Tax=Enterovirga rhinocerotis TaxID=1339210 RepID=A0A4V3DWM4_9HYPH|nr:rare lipoprotein A [Enterovirga rhinocerotis]